MCIRDSPNVKVIKCNEDLTGEDGLIRSDYTRGGLHLNDYGYVVLTNRLKDQL